MTLIPADRVSKLRPSGIRKAFALASGLNKPINLSLGQPYYDALPEVKAGAIAAIERGENGYGPNIGLNVLRERMKSHLEFASHSESSEWDVIITGGVSGGLMLAYSALLNPGDRVLIPDPFFPIYRDTAEFLQADVGYYDMYPTFVPTVEMIERSWTRETKAVVLCSPGNPTGASLRQAELDQIIEFARSKDAWVIYDEIYSELCFDDLHAQCRWRYHKAIILNAFSKSFGIPGWRIGYSLAPRAISEQMAKVQQLLYVCAPTPLQHGALAGIECDLAPLREEFRQKRDFVFNALRDHYDLMKPTGSFFCFPAAPGGSGEKFFERCLKENLIVVPGGAFSLRDTHFRLSFSASQETLERGVEALCRLVRSR